MIRCDIYPVRNSELQLRWLIRCGLAGLLRPSAGKLIVGGVDVQADPIGAKKISAYVPDQPFLYDKLSGIEFMNFIADLYGVDGAGRVKEIDRLVELFGMKDFVRELTESYSHGMKQRLVLAATLLHKPRVILVDEPLVGLDPHTARLVKQVFRDQAAPARRSSCRPTSSRSPRISPTGSASCWQGRIVALAGWRTSADRRSSRASSRTSSSRSPRCGQSL